MEYLATFHTHWGAVSFHRRLVSLGDKPVMMPVPRRLSASCGTCVRFHRTFDAAAMADEDLDRVFVLEDGGCRMLFQNQE